MDSLPPSHSSLYPHHSHGLGLKARLTCSTLHASGASSVQWICRAICHEAHERGIPGGQPHTLSLLLRTDLQGICLIHLTGATIRYFWNPFCSRDLGLRGVKELS